MYFHLNEPAAHLRRLAYQRAGAQSAATRRAVRSGARKAAMYTRHTTFPIKPDMTERAAEIGERYGQIRHDLPGHVSTVMFLDGDTFTSIST